MARSRRSISTGSIGHVNISGMSISCSWEELGSVLEQVDVCACSLIGSNDLGYLFWNRNPLRSSRSPLARSQQ